MCCCGEEGFVYRGPGSVGADGETEMRDEAIGYSQGGIVDDWKVVQDHVLDGADAADEHGARDDVGDEA